MIHGCRQLKLLFSLGLLALRGEKLSRILQCPEGQSKSIVSFSLLNWETIEIVGRVHMPLAVVAPH